MNHWNALGLFCVAGLIEWAFGHWVAGHWRRPSSITPTEEKRE